MRVFRNIALFFKSVLKGLYYHNVLWGTGLFSVSVQLYVCRINMFCEGLVTRMRKCALTSNTEWLRQYGSELPRRSQNILRQSQFEF